MALLAGLLLLLGFATILTPTPLARLLLAQQAEVIGVELETLLASATGDRAAQEGSAGGAWQVGIDRLEVRASQAVLEDVNAA